MSVATLTSLLTLLEEAKEKVSLLDAQWASDLAPLLARPSTWTLRQCKDLFYDGMHQDGFRIMRSKGDLIQCRDNLIHRRLSLDTLLREADAAMPPAGSSHVLCENPEVCAFFSTLGSRQTSVRLNFFVDAKGQRVYDIDNNALRGHPYLPSGSHAKDIMKEVKELEATVTSLRVKAASLPAKRAHVEAFEAEWKEKMPKPTKKARVDKQ